MAIGKTRKETGAEGERLALELLLADGYEILHTNWRCKIGELDIVARKQGTLIIVEVRTRTASKSPWFGTPEESVDTRKRTKLRRLAEMYMASKGMRELSVQFDVIAVTLSRNEEAAEIRHIQNAM